MSKQKKEKQLGMNPATASNRLVKDLLFKFAIDSGHTCFQCGGELTRDSFSIEHKVPWLDAEEPLSLFFDLENIAFSHLSCNVGQRRKEPSKHGTDSKYRTGCRCDYCTQAHSSAAKLRYEPNKRSDKYINTGH